MRVDPDGVAGGGGGPTVLKLGGSVVTDKDEEETVDLDALADVASAIATGVDGDSGAPSELVVVHGGGSFGHQHAATFGVSREDGTTDVDAIRTIHDAMGRLNAAVLDFLDDAGVDAVPVRPYSAAYRDRAANLELYTGQVAAMLDEGFVPVLHGDVVTHAQKGATILSGDELVTELASALDASRVGVCSTVPGVLDDADDVIPEIDDLAAVRAYLGASESTDVTGGMAAKVAALLALESPARIFGPADLAGFLAGESVGTLVHRRETTE
jgi:isopentenyl phosphate kinase